MKDTQFPNVVCYDNGGKTIDRYTAVFLDQPEMNNPNRKLFAAVGMNDCPFHPQGFGQHCTAMLGRHLGKRIDSTKLPADCQHLIRRDLDKTIQRFNITTRQGNTLSIFYNADNNLLVVDLVAANEKGGNEIVRKTLDESKMLAHTH